MRGTLQRGQNPRLPASLHRRGGDRRRRDAALAARGRGRRHLPRARPCARARHLRRRDHGRDVRQGRGLLPRARRLDAPVRCRDPLLRRQRDRRRRAAAGGRSRARRQDAGQTARDRLLLRRGRGGRGRVPRIAESRRAVETSGAVSVREQSLRDGHRARAFAKQRPICARKPRATTSAPKASMAWT